MPIYEYCGYECEEHGNHAPWMYLRIEKVIIEDGIKSIGSNAFQQLRELTEIQFGKDVSRIDKGAFRDCTSLTHVDIPGSVTSMGSFVFDACKALAVVTIPAEVTDLAPNVFWGVGMVWSDFDDEVGTLVTETDIYYAGTKAAFDAFGVKDGKYRIHYQCTDPTGYWKTESKDPTCKTEGYTREACACGHVRNEVKQEAKEHSWRDATCTDPKTCKNCGTTKGTAMGHQMGVWKVTTEATSTKVGKETRKCERKGCTRSETRDIAKVPGKPTAKASVTESSGKIKISWEKVSGASEYEIHRAGSKSGSYEKLTTTTKTSYTDKTAKAGKTYYYKVRAVNENGGTSSFSSVVSKLCKLAQPEVKSGNTASSGKVKLQWENVDNASKYYIYRATSKDGKFEKIGSTKSVSYSDGDGKLSKTYYYKVKAVYSDNTDANSAYSGIVDGTRDLKRPDVTAKASSGKVKLTWEKVSSAKEYKIYRPPPRTVLTSASGPLPVLSTPTSP